MFPYRQALVTGASGGLGRAFAEALLAEGVAVWGTSRDGAPARMPAGVKPLALDLNDAESVAALLEKISREAPELDLIINNAGDGVFAPLEQFSAAALEKQIRVLLASPAEICRRIFPKFRARQHGAIVNVASLAGDFPIPFMSAYSAAKAGVSAFSRTLMLEAAGTGVVVIDFRPGDYATGFNNATARANFPENSPPARAWECCEKHLKNGPPPPHAAKILMRALRKKRTGTIVAGDFWQAKLGPLLARFAPRALVNLYLKNYYKI